MHEKNGKKKELKQAVADAAGAGVNLSSTAFQQQAPLKEPSQFDYFVYCAGITEVWEWCRARGALKPCH